MKSNADQISEVAIVALRDEPIWVSYGFETVQTAAFDMHYVYEIGILLDGRLRCYCSDWQADIEPGDVWLTGSWERHGRKVLQNPYERSLLYIQPTFLMSLNLEGEQPVDWTTPFRVPPANRPVVRNDIREAMLSIGRRIRERAGPNGPFHDGPGHRAWQLAVLLEALVLLRESWDGFARTGGLYRSPYLPLISRAVDMVLDTSGLVRSAQAAEACGMSRNHFARQFQLFTGLPFTEFCRRHRLQGAAEQLLRTSDAVKSVAQSWGFPDQSHFIKCFRKYYECSPAEYRRRGGREPVGEDH